LLREAFSAPLSEPAPPGVSIPPDAPGEVTAFRPKRRAAAAVWAPAALAASLALVVGGALGALIGDPTAPPTAASLSVGPASAELAAALDGTPSGERREGVRPLASFALPDGGACREFEVAGDDGAAAAFGLACARREGWRVLIAGAASPGDDAAEDGYVAASGAALDAAGAVLDALNAGPAMTPDEERAALSGGWR